MSKNVPQYEIEEIVDEELLAIEKKYPLGGTFIRHGESNTRSLLTVCGKPFRKDGKVMLPVQTPNKRAISTVEVSLV